MEDLEACSLHSLFGKDDSALFPLHSTDNSKVLCRTGCYHVSGRDGHVLAYIIAIYQICRQICGRGFRFRRAYRNKLVLIRGIY